MQSGWPVKEPAEQVVKEIRRATRQQFSAEEKIRIVLTGLRGEDNIAELCRREGIVQNLYYPAQLAGVPISVGYQSGSHYSTIQALEQYLPLEQINLSFADGLLFRRMEKLIDRQVPASLFSGPYYFLEQLGFRKIIDSTFMMASMVTGDPDPDDVRKYFRALRLSQPSDRSGTRVTTGRSFRVGSATRWIPGAGGRASGLSSSSTAARLTRRRATGSPATESLPRARWASAATRT
jgi:hypothetical protein